LSTKKRPANPDSTKVTVAECFQRHEKIDLALWGKDGRSGIVNDITLIKNKVEAILNREAEIKTKKRDWRLLGFAVLGSILAGLVMAGVNYILTHLPH